MSFNDSWLKFACEVSGGELRGRDAGSDRFYGKTGNQLRQRVLMNALEGNAPCTERPLPLPLSLFSMEHPGNGRLSAPFTLLLLLYFFYFLC